MLQQPRRLFYRLVHGFQHRFQHSVDQIETQLDDPGLDFPKPARWVVVTTVAIVTGLGIGLGWAVFARIDVVVNARGQLEPLSSSQAIQARRGGVVTAVFVQEGQQVSAGQLLMQLDKTEVLNQLEALVRQREPLVKQVQVLRAARQGRPIALPVAGLKISPELLQRVKNRNLLVAQLTGDPSGLAPEQRQQYELFARGIGDKQALSQLQIGALQVQSTGTDSQLSETASRLRVEQALLANLTPLVQRGAISRTDFLRRVTETNALQNQLNQGVVQRRQLELSRLQAQVDGRKNVDDSLRAIQTELTQLDAQLDALIQSDQRQLVQLDAQIKQAKTDLESRDLKAPTNGVVFGIAAKLAGLVVQSGQVLAQVTPNETLVARSQVSNADIADIRVGMPVDVRLDAYPFTEFGGIRGEVIRVGNEAIADRSQPNGQTFFPVEIRLKQAFLQKQGRRYRISPGMTAGLNFITRSRAPIEIVAGYLNEIISDGQTVR